MQLIETLHGLWRWALALTALVAIVKLVIGLVRGAEFSETDRRVAFYFAMAVTVQWALGAVNLVAEIAAGTFVPRLHLEHMVTGTLATALAHMPPMFKKRTRSVRFIGTLALIVASMLVAILNVAVVRGNWLYKLP